MQRTYREVHLRRYGTIEGRSATVEAAVNGTQARTTVDSGASRTIIDPIFLRKLKGTSEIKLLDVGIICRGAAEDSESKIEQYVEIDIAIGDRCTSVSAVVMQLSDTDLLLGCDFYDDNDIVIDFAKKVMVWGNTEIQINLERTQIQVRRV